MADTLKSYELVCPGCDEEFTVDLAPEALADDGDLIECPACFNEWEWAYDPDADTLELLADEDSEEDDLPLVDTEEEDDEDDEDDE